MNLKWYVFPDPELHIVSVFEYHDEPNVEPYTSFVAACNRADELAEMLGWEALYF